MSYTRFYSVVQGQGAERDLIHLTLMPAGDGAWPHTLCGLRTDTNGDVGALPNCVACIAGAVRYDQALDEANRAAKHATNPCAEIWLGGLWSSGR